VANVEHLAGLQKLKSSEWDEPVRVRYHRALSWYKSAEKIREVDDDMCLLALVIAMHACYGGSNEHIRSKFTSDKWKPFIDNMKDTNESKKIESILRSTDGAEFIKKVVFNKYLHPATYKDDEATAEEKLRKMQSGVIYGANNRRDDIVLSIVIGTINVLRNQMAHGAATHDSKLNREVVLLSKEILFKIIPMMIQVIGNNPGKDWGDPNFPVMP